MRRTFGRSINLLLLQSSPLLAHATAAQLWRLSAIAHERTIAANAEALAKGGEAAILVVLSGALRVEEKDQQGTATAGDVIGMYETLAGTQLDAAVTAIKDTRVLRIDRGGAVRAARRSHRPASGLVFDLAAVRRQGRPRTPSPRPDGCSP